MKAAILARTIELSGGLAESFSLPPLNKNEDATTVRADTDTNSDLQDNSIAWVSEHPTDSCSEITYDFPASMVPIQDDAAATGGLEWHSFDQQTTLYYETKATYFSVTGKTYASFLNTVRCNAKLNSVLGEALGQDNAGNKGSKLISC